MQRSGAKIIGWSGFAAFGDSSTLNSLIVEPTAR
jgi:hypothetical protein